MTGLITGSDIIEQLKGKIKEDILLIPTNMLKADEDVFLDDVTLANIKNEFGIKIVKCKYSGDDFVDKIVNEVL